MQVFNPTDVIPYSSASNMARAFEESCQKLQEAQRLVEEAVNAVNDAFQTVEDRREFKATVSTGCHHNDTTEVYASWKLNAWEFLIDKLGVRKTMSSKRQQELSELFHGRSYDGIAKRAAQLPDITEETIFSVLMGYCSSAEEFLEEAIREEYDFWKCHNLKADLKTNRKSLWKLDRKVIKSYMVNAGYRAGKFDLNYDRQRHLIALDNIFHLLDGKGCIDGYNGPLVDVIKAAVGGAGETEYFSFKCFKNGNLHLEFKRLDLLQKFNEICGRNRLPDAMAV